MHCRKSLAFVGMAVIGLSLFTATTRAEKDAKADKKDDGHAAHFAACAKACALCASECESCATHCAHLLADGKKEHLRTLQTCRDCAEFCVAAGRIVSRHGPLAVAICEACAKACDVCGAACEKHPDDEHMKGCAKACRDCAKACRDMIQHTGHAEPKEAK